MDESELTPPPRQSSTLRLRKSISSPVAVPTNLTLPTTKPIGTSSSLPNGTASSSPPVDLELISLRSSFASYTSLKDILPSLAAINSPTASGCAMNSGYEISIRNRLVKQAAWAYLQPMSSSPDSSGSHFLRRLWLRLSSQSPISNCLRFIQHSLLPGLTRVFDRVLRVIGVQAAR